MRSILFFKAVVFSTLFVSCTSSDQSTDQKADLNLFQVDSTVRIQDDLFRFVNGIWMDSTTIPSDRGSWGAFAELREQNREALLQLLNEALEKDNREGSIDQNKAIEFYGVGMDSLLAEQVGTSVLDPVLAQIDAIKNASQLQRYLVEHHYQSAFWSFSVYADIKNSERMAAYLGSGGLGLEERDYYLKKDKKSVEIRNTYLQYIMTMFALSGVEKDPKKSKYLAKAIMDIETRLAKATLTKEERRDLSKQYNKKSISELQEIVPAIDWNDYFQGLGVQEDSIIVTEPAFMKMCKQIVENGSWETIQWYLKWDIINGAAPFLNWAMVHEHFAFYSQYLRDIEEIKPRWKRVLDVTSSYFGESLGQLYVAKFFPAEAKEKALEMIGNIRLAMADRIKNLDWMTDSTKTVALKKLSAFSVKVGYPDTWRSYAELEVGQMSYYRNLVKAVEFELKRAIDKLGKPVNRKEWFMSPQTVNAYYNPVFNEIVFPAGILQPPFYNYKADEAVNYGGIGAVIGHEISHGFDDQGSKFDSEGNLKNWWKKEDLERFQEKGKALISQYDAYEPLPGVFVQGTFTLGENIGDLAGLTVAYDGLQRFLREQGRPPLIDGYTPEQRFFMSWGVVWRIKLRDEALRVRINTDPHSPGYYRANGPVSNMASFYKAFDVKKGDQLYREEEDRVQIW